MACLFTCKTKEIGRLDLIEPPIHMPRIRPYLRTKRKVELRNLSQVEAERIRGELQTFPAATQPADLIAANAYFDIGTQIDTAIAAIGSIVVLKGTWDASSGSFPGAGATSSGWSYIVSIGGTVDGISFVSGDRIIAIVDDASTTTYDLNWLKLDYTDLVSSVSGRTGAVVLTRSDVGLGNVDNTSDADKPVSVAVQTALDGKSDTGHAHTISDITDFGDYQPASVNLDGWAAVNESDYYTATETDAAIASAAAGTARFVTEATTVEVGEHVIVANTEAIDVTIASGAAWCQVSRTTGSTHDVTVVSEDAPTVTVGDNADGVAINLPVGPVSFFLSSGDYKVVIPS